MDVQAFQISLKSKITFCVLLSDTVLSIFAIFGRTYIHYRVPIFTKGCCPGSHWSWKFLLHYLTFSAVNFLCEYLIFLRWKKIYNTVLKHFLSLTKILSRTDSSLDSRGPISIEIATIQDFVKNSFLFSVLTPCSLYSHIVDFSTSLFFSVH